MWNWIKDLFRPRRRELKKKRNILYEGIKQGFIERTESDRKWHSDLEVSVDSFLSGKNRPVSQIEAMNLIRTRTRQLKKIENQIEALTEMVPNIPDLSAEYQSYDRDSGITSRNIGGWKSVDDNTLPGRNHPGIEASYPRDKSKYREILDLDDLES